jgi:hypothetical protein
MLAVLGRQPAAPRHSRIAQQLRLVEARRRATSVDAQLACALRRLVVGCSTLLLLWGLITLASTVRVTRRAVCRQHAITIATGRPQLESNDTCLVAVSVLIGAAIALLFAVWTMHQWRRAAATATGSGARHAGYAIVVVGSTVLAIWRTELQRQLALQARVRIEERCSHELRVHVDDQPTVRFLVAVMLCALGLGVVWAATLCRRLPAGHRRVPGGPSVSLAHSRAMTPPPVP